jgi:hypothetical protein
MAIKRPNISKPGIVKPNMGKKAPVAKPVVEVAKEQVEEQVVEQVEENEIEVSVEEEIEIPEDMIETPSQVVEEPKQEEVVAVEEVIEEVIEESSAPKDEECEVVENEEVIEEPVKEEKPKKKSSRKKTTKKEEKVVESKEEEPIEVKDYKAKPLVDAMKEMIGITGCTTPEWEQTKAEIMEQVKGMHIDPDSTPAEMRYLIADIDAALSQLKIYKVNADQQFNPLLKHINYVSLQAGSKGANSEERKANAIRGLIEYKANPDDAEYTNLLDIQVFAENQIAFYDEMIKILQDKKNMLITFSGIVKTETQLGGY